MEWASLLEEELKIRVGETFFADYDTAGRMGRVDFAVHPKDAMEGFQSLFGPDKEGPTEYFLWAEAKSGTKQNIYDSLVQLILTIGRERINEKKSTLFLGAFDAEKIAFIPYSKIEDVFVLNDFDWTVQASDHKTKEFGLLHNLIGEQLEDGSLLFHYSDDETELRDFIRKNFRFGGVNESTVQVNRNNFTHVFRRWLEVVKPTIAIDWDRVQKRGIISADFFLADLLSRDNATLREKLFVLLEHDHYTLERGRDEDGLLGGKSANFSDGQMAHRQFWAHYKRPPRKEYWDYMVERRDLLVPQNIRERKGAFFTPQKWVRLSQEYLAHHLGEEWQERYYVWDCCAGTGNLLVGLTEPYRTFASTLDQADVDVMLQQITEAVEKKGEANLLQSHVFRFDFLNDDLCLDGTPDPETGVPEGCKLPTDLWRILRDPEERKRLVIYINPPYAEPSNARTQRGTGQNRAGLSDSLTLRRYESVIGGKAIKELSVQFFIRIYCELRGCILGEFSKLKTLQGSNFIQFRSVFKPRLKSLFIVPAYTFDNVTGKFPIGFYIWDTSEEEEFSGTTADVYDANGGYEGRQEIQTYERNGLIIDWLRRYYDTAGDRVGYLRMLGTDMQHNKDIFISNDLSPNDFKKHLYTIITRRNLIPCCIYNVVRHVIEHTWRNDFVRFTHPSDEWQEDQEFLSDCLCYALFDSSNNVSMALGVNHWIPFEEEEVGTLFRYESHFMVDFMQGRLEKSDTGAQQLPLDGTNEPAQSPIYDGSQVVELSPEAEMVMEAGRKLWRYYHSQKNAEPKPKPDAALYDIRDHFQGRNDRGIMNAKSDDPYYTELIDNLRRELKYLGDHKIAPKVYKYGFLKSGRLISSAPSISITE